MMKAIVFVVVALILFFVLHDYYSHKEDNVYSATQLKMMQGGK